MGSGEKLSGTIAEVRFGRHGYKPGPEEPDFSQISTFRRVVYALAFRKYFKQTWEEAIERLGIKNDPGLKYENLPLIYEKARRYYDELPQEATVLFTATHFPRARLTADLTSTFLMQIAEARKDKDIRVGYLMRPNRQIPNPDPFHVVEDPRNIVEIDDVGGGLTELMFKMNDIDPEYQQGMGGQSIPHENEMLGKAAEVDLDPGNADSRIRKRAAQLKVQLRNLLTRGMPGAQGPVYVYAVGHHSNYIVSDLLKAELEGKEHALVIPEPLDASVLDETALRVLRESE